MAHEITWLEYLDYFLRGYLKSHVYETLVEKDMELDARIVATCDVIRNTPGIFGRARQNICMYMSRFNWGW